MTKKRNWMIIGAAALVSICIAGRALYRPSKKEAGLSFIVYKAVNGWGYDILVNSRPFIHQESVPGREGRQGFAFKQQAEKAALIVINKIQRNQRPTLTNFEVQSILTSSSLPDAHNQATQ